ncbi:MAG: hydroxyisourate hydrolase [Candidatus Sericytochromatia bacterium]
MITLSTHALDTTLGRPAAGLPVMLERQADAQAWRAYCQSRLTGGEAPKPAWEKCAQGVTNTDGRCPELLPEGLVLTPGIYRMDFDTAAYFAAHTLTGFYPLVQVIFEITSPGHYHIPLLLSPYGYSTYRGS